jgi:type VI secretion system secreted protein VgrG
MQYGEDDLHFITRLLGEVGIWFRFTTDTRLNIDVVEFYDSQQGYEKGLTLPSVPPSGQHSQGVDSVWGMESHHTWCRSRSAPATTTTVRPRRT